MRWKLFRPAPSRGVKLQAGKGRWRPQAPLAPMPSTKASILAVATDEQTMTHLREAVILAAFLTCPELIHEYESGLETMACADPDHARMRDLILRFAGQGAAVLHENLTAALGPDALENLLSQRHVAITPCVRNPGNLEMAQMTVAEELAKLRAARLGCRNRGSR